MVAIGIIDDRDEDRSFIESFFRLAGVEDSWRIMAIRPFDDLNAYPVWISENKVCVLVIDELLDEIVLDGSAVNYKGHDLIEFLRGRTKTLPLFVITAHSNETQLVAKFKDIEGIIERSDFYRDYANYVPRITRSAQQYLHIFQEELIELAQISRDIAMGNSISDEEKRKLIALQTKLDIEYSTGPIMEIGHLVSEMEELLRQITSFREELLRKLGGDN
jgi:HAMP domain-containing protein